MAVRDDDRALELDVQLVPMRRRHLLYAQALLTVDWLVERGGEPVLTRLTAAVRDGKSYADALESTTGFTPSALDERVGTALRQSLPPRFPVGVPGGQDHLNKCQFDGQPEGDHGEERLVDAPERVQRSA